MCPTHLSLPVSGYQAPSPFHTGDAPVHEEGLTVTIPLGTISPHEMGQEHTLAQHPLVLDLQVHRDIGVTRWQNAMVLHPMTVSDPVGLQQTTPSNPHESALLAFLAKPFEGDFLLKTQDIDYTELSETFKHQARVSVLKYPNFLYCFNIDSRRFLIADMPRSKAKKILNLLFRNESQRHIRLVTFFSELGIERVKPRPVAIEQLLALERNYIAKKIPLSDFKPTLKDWQNCIASFEERATEIEHILDTTPAEELDSKISAEDAENFDSAASGKLVMCSYRDYYRDELKLVHDAIQYAQSMIDSLEDDVLIFAQPSINKTTQALARDFAQFRIEQEWFLKNLSHIIETFIDYMATDGALQSPAATFEKPKLQLMNSPEEIAFHELEDLTAQYKPIGFINPEMGDESIRICVVPDMVALNALLELARLTQRVRPLRFTAILPGLQTSDGIIRLYVGNQQSLYIVSGSKAWRRIQTMAFEASEDQDAPYVELTTGKDLDSVEPDALRTRITHILEDPSKLAKLTTKEQIYLVKLIPQTQLRELISALADNTDTLDEFLLGMDFFPGCPEVENLCTELDNHLDRVARTLPSGPSTSREESRQLLEERESNMIYEWWQENRSRAVELVLAQLSKV